MKRRLTGGCLCGAVRYDCEADPTVAVCHCKDCQKHTGSAFSVVVFVPMAGMTVTGALTDTYSTGELSGKQVRRRFCGSCGSPIFSEPEVRPGVRVIRAGTLDDTSWVNPAFHIWTASKQPWVPIPPGVPTYPKAKV